MTYKDYTQEKDVILSKLNDSNLNIDYRVEYFIDLIDGYDHHLMIDLIHNIEDIEIYRNTIPYIAIPIFISFIKFDGDYDESTLSKIFKTLKLKTDSTPISTMRHISLEMLRHRLQVIIISHHLNIPYKPRYDTEEPRVFDYNITEMTFNFFLENDLLNFESNITIIMLCNTLYNVDGVSNRFETFVFSLMKRIIKIHKFLWCDVENPPEHIRKYIAKLKSI